jgi:hypothetical protein
MSVAGTVVLVLSRVPAIRKALIPAIISAGIFLQSGCYAAVAFNIEVVYEGTWTDAQKTAFSAAESKWESLLPTYHESITSLSPNLYITAIISLNSDGPGGLLGGSRPTHGKYQPGTSYLLASKGVMEFDTADIAGLESKGAFGNVILHEMAHVMGFGTLWSSSAGGWPGFQEVYVAGSGQYTGTNALEAYRTEFNQPGATFVPVELGGGLGTADGHWDEVDGGAGPTGITDPLGRDMRYELMTGWLNMDQDSFISQTTLGSFRDIGYTLAPVPAPAALALLGTGLVAVFTMRRRRKNRGALGIPHPPAGK